MKLPWNLKEVVSAAEPEHWRESLLSLAFTALGLLPLWGGVIVAVVTPRIQFLDLIQHGELAHYSTALVFPALYVVVSQRSNTQFKGRPYFVLVGIFVSVAAAILFASVAAVENVSLERVIPLSVLLFLSSVIFSFVVSLIDNVRLSPNPQAATDKRQRDLEEHFNRLKGSVSGG